MKLPHLTIERLVGQSSPELDELNSPKDSRLFDDTAELLPVPLACQGRLEASFLTGGNEEGVPLHFPNDVLLLDFPLEAPKGAFERFIISEPNLCQRISPAFRMVPPGRPVLLVSIHTGGETLPSVHDTN